MPAPLSSFCIHTGAPESPANINSTIQDYQSNFAMMEITWNPPLNHDPQIDYFHYEIIDTSNEPLVMDGNTSNTSAIFKDIPYNNDLTFSLYTVNCVGRSSPITYHISIGKIHDCNLIAMATANINNNIILISQYNIIYQSCSWMSWH